jgi:ABC-type xylose transport system permease subunit
VTPPNGIDRDDWYIVAGGLIAVAGSFAPWYRSRDMRFDFNGWELGFTAVVAVLLAAYAAARVLYLRDRPQKPEVPVTPQAETFVASAVALALMVYRVLDAPTIEGLPSVRTYGIVMSGIAVLVQFVAVAHKVGRTGFKVK